MSDVFISYASQDRQQAGWLAGLLAERGWSVFWDRTIPPGTSWDEVIGSELGAARAVVVLWSEAGVASPWVIEEAHEGKQRGVLVPVLLDEVRLPFGFRRIQAASLLDWSGDAGHPGLAELLRALSAMLGEPLPPTAETAGNPGGGVVGRPAAPSPPTSGASRPSSPEPEMVTIPAGSFRMGSDASEDRNDGERPVRTVTFAKPFAIGKFPVTFEEYDRFAATAGRTPPPDENWGRANRPVINVSWQDAVDYAAWLAEQTGKRYRLPTEAEWEYAARAGTQTTYWWGDEVRRGETVMANCNGCGSEWDNKMTAPVGQFEANAFGLHDVHGNVWEWVQDCWHGSYNGPPDDGSAWLEGEGGDCGLRLLRGGSWADFDHYMSSASIVWNATGGAYNDFGFRLAQDP